MRQVGVLAAAGIVALEEMVDRLGEDHLRAAKLAQGLSEISEISLDKGSPNTNMVYIQLNPDLSLTAETLRQHLSDRDILVGVTGPRHFRLVCHNWIDDSDVDRVVTAFRKILETAWV